MQLAAYTVVTHTDGGSAARARVSMALGALRALGAVWPIAVAIIAQVKDVAREVFAAEPGAAAEGGRTPPGDDVVDRLMDVDGRGAGTGHGHADGGIGEFVHDEAWLDDEMVDFVP